MDAKRRRALGETIAAVGVIASMVFVGLRKLIEDSTSARERFVCRVDLQALRDQTVLGQEKN